MEGTEAPAQFVYVDMTIPVSIHFGEQAPKIPLDLCTHGCILGRKGARQPHHRERD